MQRQERLERDFNGAGESQMAQRWSRDRLAMDRREEGKKEARNAKPYGAFISFDRQRSSDFFATLWEFRPAASGAGLNATKAR